MNTTTRRRRRKPSSVVSLHTDPWRLLPFVEKSERAGLPPRRFWVVEPTTDGRKARDLGRRYAVRYLQFLNSGPVEVGALAWMVRDMARSGVFDAGQRSPDGAHACAVGFLSFLELFVRELLKASRVDTRALVKAITEKEATARAESAANDTKEDES